MTTPAPDTLHLAPRTSHLALRGQGKALVHNLVLFGRLLRGLGLDVNPGRVIDLTNALNHINIGQKQDFYHTARSLLVHKREDIPLFDQAFELFWRKHGMDAMLDIGDLFTFRPRSGKPIIIPPPLNEGSNDGGSEEDDDGEPQTVIEVTRTYSNRERLFHKDFGEMTADEEAAIKQFMGELVWELGTRRTRRSRPGRGTQLDLRRSLRQNLRYGGELIEWPTRERKSKPRPLVVIADISGSMERYTRLLLHFIYSLAEGLTNQVEAFVFSTRLTRITRQIRGKDIDWVLHEVGHVVTDWAGGTRIGESLKAFNYDWARRVTGRGAVVLVISDGWDRGDPTLLSEEIERLQRNCYRLIWLNPLLGSPRYEPLTRGIQAALPYIDDFLPVHNLASLEDLASHLAGLRSLRTAQRRAISAVQGKTISQSAFATRS